MSQPCLIIKETLFLFHCQVSPSSVLHLRAPLWASNACCPQCPCGLIRELCLSAGCLSCKPSAHLESNGARLRRIADLKKEKKEKVTEISTWRALKTQQNQKSQKVSARCNVGAVLKVKVPSQFSRGSLRNMINLTFALFRNSRLIVAP